jgi:serine/threonine protein kinase
MLSARKGNAVTQQIRRLIGGVYRVGQVITREGMLTTCTAYNRNTNDVVGLVVIEFLSLSVHSIEQLLQPLASRSIAQSPHVLHIHDWGIDGNRAYIAVDPPRGVTLRYVLDNENVDTMRAIDFIKQIANGVKALHEQGIVGLDLRPQFITVDTIDITDRVQIDDIGLRTLLQATDYQPGSRVDDIGYLDPRYAPPEYIKHTQLGPGSDIYQLGLLLFEFITGRPPFVGRTQAETGIMQNTYPVPRMSQYAHGTPNELEEIVNCALAKDPSHRFANVGAFLNALEAVPQSSPQSTVSEHPHLEAKDAQPSTALTNEMTSIESGTSRGTGSETGKDSNPVLPAIAPDRKIYAYLYYEKTESISQRIAIQQKNVIIGRIDPKRDYTPDIDLSPLDPNMTVSRQHARIRFEETFFYIEDLKSRNKTRLGELVLTPLKAELLQHGDTLTFGKVRVRFEVPGMKPLKKPKAAT